jgi:transcription elongation GreA/GreB family factor
MVTMSKAFTRESDLEASEGSIPRRKLSASGGSVITAAGAKRFQIELEQLTAEKQAREAAGEDASRVKSRIRHLQELLRSCAVAELPVDRDSVALGAKVKVRYGSGDIVQYEVVGLEESEPERDRISAQSPLGRELMGHRAGERFRFNAPAGEELLEILEINYAPEQ